MSIYVSHVVVLQYNNIQPRTSIYDLNENCMALNDSNENQWQLCVLTIAY